MPRLPGQPERVRRAEKIGLREVRADTTVELGSGQSFAIGGLISNSTRNNLEKVPALGQ